MYGGRQAPQNPYYPQSAAAVMGYAAQQQAFGGRAAAGGFYGLPAFGGMTPHHAAPKQPMREPKVC